MDLRDLIGYVRSQSGAVISSLSPAGAPQSAYLDMTATDLGELVFNARTNSRKIANISADPRVAVVIGGSDGTTLQCEGFADLPTGTDLDRCAGDYVQAFPQFHTSATRSGIVIGRVRLSWARFGDFRRTPAVLREVELGLASA